MSDLKLMDSKDNKEVVRLYSLDVFIEGVRTTEDSEYMNKSEAIETIQHLKYVFNL